MSESETAVANLAAQLSDLYEEKETMSAEIGVNSAADIVPMVKTLVAQLESYCFRELRLGDRLPHRVKNLVAQMNGFHA